MPVSTIPLASAVSGTLPDGSAPSGSVIQVVQTVKTDVFSTSSTSWVDWTGMSASITPQSSSSRILVMLTSGCSSSADNSFQYVKLQRNGADIALGDAAGGATRCWIDASWGSTGNFGSFVATQKTLAGSFLDSPNSTSAVTYKLQALRTFNGTAFFGRTANVDDANRSSIPSVLTLMEIEV